MPPMPLFPPPNPVAATTAPPLPPLQLLASTVASGSALGSRSIVPPSLGPPSISIPPPPISSSASVPPPFRQTLTSAELQARFAALPPLSLQRVPSRHRLPVSYILLLVLSILLTLN